MTDVLSGLGDPQRTRVAALRAEGRFFWLDVSLGDTSPAELAEALAVPEDALRGLPGSGDASVSRIVYADGQSVAFTLRCYVESGGPPDEGGYRLRPLEVRIVVTSEYLLTIHAEGVSLPAALAPSLPGERSGGYVVYVVLDAMVESAFDALGEIEVRLEGLGASWSESGGGKVPRAGLQAAGLRLATMRRWATAQQGVVERAGVEIAALRGFENDDESYFDRVDQQADRLPLAIDAAADALGMLLDLQLNERAYIVSVVAAIFVPLTFLTGFFGMNFNWMIDRVDSQVAFWLLGVGVPVVIAALSWRFLIRRFLVGDQEPRRH